MRPWSRRLGSVVRGGGRRGASLPRVAAPPRPAVLDTSELLLDERGLTVGTGYSAWANQGTAGGSFTQGTGANQPATGTMINGLPAPAFDGVNDKLVSSLNASAYMTTTAYEGFVVFSAHSVAADGIPSSTYTMPALLAVTGASAFDIAVSKAGAWHGVGNSPYNGTPPTPGVYADGAAHLLSFRFDTGRLYIRLDYDTEYSIAYAGTASLAFVVNMGCNYAGAAFANCDIATVCVRKTVLTPTERAACLAYLAYRYATPTYVGARVFAWAGDSITANSVVGSAQFRAGVETLYLARADGIRFYRVTGPYYAAAVPFTYDLAYGAGGAKIADWRAFFSTAAYQQRFPTITHLPLLIGTNDAPASTAATIATAYAGLLGDVKTALPSCRVIAQSICNRTDDLTANSRIDDFNTNYLPGIIATAVSGGQDVIADTTLHDMVVAGTAPLMGDGLHLAASGNTAISAAMEARTRAWAGVPP